jgi:tetratricopeptide (TPR) repeat protein
MRNLMTILILILMAVPAAAQSNWGGRTSAGEWAFSRGNFERAETEFRAALEIAQDFPEGDVRLEESLRNLGRLYEHQSLFDKAEPMYLLLLAAEEHRVGPDSPEILDTLAALARVSVPSGDHPVAIDSLERFVAISDSAGITDDDRLRVVLASMARIYLIEERGDKALEAQRRTTTMAIANPGLEPGEQAAALESLAQMEIRFGNPEAAPELINRAATLMLQADPSASVDSIYLGAARTALAEGENQTAATLFDAFKTRNPSTQTTLETARLDADISWAAVRRESASVIDLMAVTEDPDALQTAADALTLQNTLERAEEPQDDSARLQTLDRLVRVTVMQGDLEAATDFQIDRVALLEKSSGSTSQQAQLALRTEIDLLLARQRNTEAAEANQKLISSMERTWGEDDPRLLPSLRLQYDLLKDARRKKEARAIKKKIKRLER